MPTFFITLLVNLSNQIQLRERASYSYCARSWRQQTNPSRKTIFHRVENVIKQNNWFIRQLCVHRDMKHLGHLESPQEAGVLSKLPACFIASYLDERTLTYEQWLIHHVSLLSYIWSADACTNIFCCSSLFHTRIIREERCVAKWRF